MANEDFFESILSFSISFYTLRQSIAYPLEIKKLLLNDPRKSVKSFLFYHFIIGHNWG